ncbi:protein kinase family protein [Nocardioides aestuarii]|uniref:Protein kinase n=1 Tax=Nocardioides aestuarii TaxID=252231 RepID=A0ABW4TPJ4_9ACTN
MLADRYLLVDLLTESGSGRFWRAHDRVLERHVALHCLDAADPLAEQMTQAARLSATVHDRRLLRVLDADRDDHTSYVVHEWGSGTSLDNLVQAEGPLAPRRAAWIVSEVADALVPAHEQRVAHGRLTPENVLIDQTGQIRLIGFCVDAALLGLPPGRVSDDVTDAVALLYFLLTGRWAGVASSEMPAAMREHGKHGRWLRPRQVRAGIPRVLDSICDQVLNPFDASAPGDGGYNVHTARGLVETLQEYVGDPTDLVQPVPLGGVLGAGALAVPQRRAPGDHQASAATTDPEPTATMPVAPVIPPSPSPAAEAEPPPTVSSPDEAPTDEQSPVNVPPPPVESPVETPAGSPVDVPTQAGMPIFDDEADDVSWLEKRSEPPPPPPAFEEPPERPLFAPEPEDGGPARRPKPGAPAPATGDYWPWESTGPGTGSGVIPVTEDPDDEDEEVPGRSWFRLGGLALLSLLLVLAIVVAYNLGRGRTPLGAEPEDEQPSRSPSRSAAPEPEPITGLTARDFDPQSDDGVENPDSAPLAVDGDPATAWRTSTYFDQLGPPPGLKTGVGLVIDLGETREFTQVDLTTIGSPTDVSYFVSDTDPTAVAGLQRIGRGTTEDDTLSTTLDEPASGQYLVVWLTALPPVGGDFRGEIAEVVVSG